MLTLDLNTGSIIKSEQEDQVSDYPDEVLDAEWNPVLTQIHPVQSDERKPSIPPVSQIMEDHSLIEEKSPQNTHHYMI